MARRMNRSVPGVRVPQAIIDRLDAASDPGECAIEVSAPILRELAAMSRGLHLIAVGWESRFQALLEAAGIEREAGARAQIGGGEHAG
jgi:methylenetetrahydrofolate reductase (NADPH)